jgi:formiminotetrahydrofolate cyclodeaminase
MAFGKEVARAIRTSGGGLPALRAKEIDLASKGQVQISTVLTDYKTTSIQRVMDEISERTVQRGVKISGTEIVGLLPREALLDFAVESLRVENFNPEIQILENRLAAVQKSSSPYPLPQSDWLGAFSTLAAAFSSTEPVPGGGAGAAVAAGIGASLGLMAIGISLKSKKLDPSRKPALEEAQVELGRLLSRFQKLAKADAEAFDNFMKQAASPKEDSTRTQRMQEALFQAAQVPLETAQTSIAAHRLVSGVVSLCSPAVTSDAQCARHLTVAGVQCALENVRINLSLLKDPIKKVAVEGPLETCERYLKEISLGA